MSKIVLFIFAGREENMRVQWPYLTRLLEKNTELEIHLWDLTRRESDAKYIRTLEDDRLKVFGQLHPGHPIRCMYPGAQKRRRGYPPCHCLLHKAPFEQPYRYYAANPDEYAGTLFVKVDDDVLFLETERFRDLLDPLLDHPERVISANVINNAVCAKYEPELVEIYQPTYGHPRSLDNDRAWWSLHVEPEFAKASHDWFLEKKAPELLITPPNDSVGYIRTREGEAISINCIAFTYLTMESLASSFHKDKTLGDEGAVDALLPWIALDFHAAHLTFGPQEKALTEYELDYYRLQYKNLRKDYLGE